MNKLLAKVKASINEAFPYQSGVHTKQYQNGDVYVGEFARGHRHGRGTYVSAKGAKYDGQWKNDMRHGQGKLTIPVGEAAASSDLADAASAAPPAPCNVYEGEWIENKKQGKGVFLYANGDKYDGEWRDDKKHGHGVYTFANSDRFDGAFANNDMHGHGVLHFADGSHCAGTWRNDQRHGVAILTRKDGMRIEQTYVKGTLTTSKELGQLLDADEEEETPAPSPLTAAAQPPAEMDAVSQLYASLDSLAGSLAATQPQEAAAASGDDAAASVAADIEAMLASPMKPAQPAPAASTEDSALRTPERAAAPPAAHQLALSPGDVGDLFDLPLDDEEHTMLNAG